MSDIVEKYGKSQIQHGKYNDRVYLMKLHPGDLPGILAHLDELARGNGYSKIFAKIPASAAEAFTAAGYGIEAEVPGFYGGEEKALFLGRYFSEERRREDRPETVEKVIAAAREKAGKAEEAPLENGLRFGVLDKSDADEMAEVYKEVFATYPFPIHDPEYLRRTMDDNLVYFGIRENGKLIAVSSAEMDFEGKNAEMTDFATLPECRGRGMASYLLAKMEEEMGKRSIQTAFTIARAYSFGMNVTFAKGGYTYSGTLTHNTNISGDLESMNVWYKPLGRCFSRA